MNNSNDQTYWNTRWENQHTGWAIGYPAPAICRYIDQYKNKQASILIPGCGHAYEAAYLIEKGFENLTLLDISPVAVAQLQYTFRDYPQVNIYCQDFFEHQGLYDLLIEQTFFCAIPVEKRSLYARHAAALLNKSGKIAGLLFNREFEAPGPPFGGNAEQYRLYFDPYFTVKTMEPCTHSIAARENKELFILLQKK